MSRDDYSDAFLRDILSTVKTIAMVGASEKETRPSYRVFGFLVAHGYQVIGVNPGLAGKSVHGAAFFKTLADVPGPIDMVDIFRNSPAAGGVVEALALDPRPWVIWMQLGVRDDAAAARARAVGVKVVMNRCPKIEYERLAIGKAHGMRFDEPVLDLLAVASRGLPGRLRQLITQLAGDDEITLAAARQKLGFCWAEDMVAYWSAILVENEPPDELRNLITGPDPDESMRRLRLFLHHFYARELCQPPFEGMTDPALMHIEESAWKELVARFNERASASEVTPQELWHALALRVLSGDHFEAVGALTAGLGVRRQRKLAKT
jgi:predicted CoA-binding protein